MVDEDGRDVGRKENPLPYPTLPSLPLPFPYKSPQGTLCILLKYLFRPFSVVWTSLLGTRNPCSGPLWNVWQEFLPTPPLLRDTIERLSKFTQDTGLCTKTLWRNVKTYIVYVLHKKFEIKQQLFVIKAITLCFTLIGGSVVTIIDISRKHSLWTQS